MRNKAIILLLLLASFSWGMELKRLPVIDDPSAILQWDLDVLDYRYRQAGKGSNLSVGATQTLTASTVINISNGIIPVVGSGAITSTSFLPNGTNNQMIIIVGTSNTNTITLQSGTSYNMLLNSGVSFKLGRGDSIVLLFLTSIGDWVEIQRLDVLG